MTIDYIVTIVIALISSSIVSSLFIAFFGRHKSKAEVTKIGTSSKVDNAQAYGLWLSSNLTLQKSLDELRDRAEAESIRHIRAIAELEESYLRKLKVAEAHYQEKFESLRLELSGSIEALRERIRELEGQRLDLLEENRALRKGENYGNVSMD